MNILELMRQRLDALLTERNAVDDQANALFDAMAAEQRSEPNEAEAAQLAELRAEVRRIDEQRAQTEQRIAEIEAAQAARAAADAAIVSLRTNPAPAPAGASAVRVTGQPATYRRDGDASFFYDMVNRSVDPDAADRIGRNQAEMREVERRAGTTANLAGLIPPQYLIDLFAPIVRSGRITAGLVDNRPLPPLGTSFNFGRATTGTLVGAQALENASLSNQDFDDTLSSFSLTTIGGYTEMSRQEIERSANGDEMVVMDLASIYSNELNRQVVAGSGASGQLKGILNATGILAVTYTDASPTVAELYPKLADAIQQVNTQRQMPASAIVMHPRRWGWFTAALDSQNRPLVNINGGAFNSMGGDSADAAFGVGGPVGTLMGLPVYIDPTVPTNLGAGTNEDRIIISRFVDNKLFEDTGVVPYRMYEEPGSAALTLRIVVAGYAAFTAERYAVANAVISGTGLVTPTF